MKLARQAHTDEKSQGAEASSFKARPSRLTVQPTFDEIYYEIVPDMTKRLVEAVHPLRVVLFGSAARGDMGPESDLDVLVVLPNGRDRKQATKDAQLSLRGLGFATDILVVTEGALAQHKDDPWMVYRSALSEGKELYHAENRRT